MDGVQMTGTANVAVRTSQTVLPRLGKFSIAQITDQIDFAPTAPGKKLILRSWERQPSTPFLARHKSRKIWKRFRKSMEAIRSRTAPSAPSRIEESDFVNEISQSANAPYLRAVKRQRVLHTQTERGASFLETKWELEIGRRMRKLVGRAEDEQLVANSQEDENEADGDNLAQSLDESSQSAGLTTAADAAENNTSSEDDEDTDRSAVISEIVDLAVDAQGGQVAAEVRELIAKQGPSLVRSALRMNSLDGEDVALLSEFLSRAQAKRAANAAMASGEESDIRQKKVEEVSSPAVQSRRALEELDVNSPSIQKPAISTPVKAEKLPESPDAPEPTADDTSHLTSSPTVACRRSTRTKPSTTQQTRSLRPAVPNQIPVRRANGTEFVFLQRTEAQELALTTRKNTRRNKGNALLPRFLLQAILKQERNDETTQPMTRIEEKNEPCQSPGKRSSRPKQVCWKEDKLVEYAPERISPMSVESPSPAKKKSSTSRREGDKTSSMTTTPALPATPSKKVRRINMAASSSVDDSSARAIKPVGTPIPKRKKLTPRLKSTAESSSDHSSKDALLSATKLAKHIPSTSQQTLQKMSGIPRSKTLIKPPSAATSSAGVTPVVKRVRHRRAAV